MNPVSAMKLVLVTVHHKGQVNDLTELLNKVRQ